MVTPQVIQDQDRQDQDTQAPAPGTPPAPVTPLPVLDHSLGGTTCSSFQIVPGNPILFPDTQSSVAPSPRQLDDIPDTPFQREAWVNLSNSCNSVTAPPPDNAPAVAAQDVTAGGQPDDSGSEEDIPALVERNLASLHDTAQDIWWKANQIQEWAEDIRSRATGAQDPLATRILDTFHNSGVGDGSFTAWQDTHNRFHRAMSAAYRELDAVLPGRDGQPRAPSEPAPEPVAGGGAFPGHHPAPAAPAVPAPKVTATSALNLTAPAALGRDTLSNTALGWGHQTPGELWADIQSPDVTRRTTTPPPASGNRPVPAIPGFPTGQDPQATQGQAQVQAGPTVEGNQPQRQVSDDGQGPRANGP